MSRGYRKSFGPEHVAELRHSLRAQHLRFLKAQEPNDKLEAIQSFRAYTSEFLNLVAHYEKFNLKETDRVLASSVEAVSDFDPRDASLAFEYLAKYAHNLLDQPWRDEFRVIHLTSGFYLHNIRAHLKNPQELLIVMGYVGTEEYTMELARVPDPNMLTVVSEDCYKASQECLALSQIWQRSQAEVPDYPFTVLKAYETRKTLIGDINTMVAQLIYGAKKFQHETQQAQELQKYLRSQEHGVATSRLIDTDHDASSTTDTELAEFLQNSTNEAMKALRHCSNQNVTGGGKQHSSYQNGSSNIHPEESSVSYSGSSHQRNSSSPENLPELQDLAFQKLLIPRGMDESYVSPTTKKAMEGFHDSNQKVANFRNRKTFGATESRTMMGDNRTNSNLNKSIGSSFGVINEKKSGGLGPQPQNFVSSPPRVNPQEIRNRIMSRPPPSKGSNSQVPATSIPYQTLHNTFPSKNTSNAFKGLRTKQDFPKSFSNPDRGKHGGNPLTTENDQDKSGRGTSQQSEGGLMRHPGNRPQALTLSKVEPGCEEEFEYDNSSASMSFNGGRFDTTAKTKTLPSFNQQRLYESKGATTKPHYDDKVPELITQKPPENWRASVNQVAISKRMQKANNTKTSPWDCPYCTYKNRVNEKVCEVCYKSKDFVLDPDSSDSNSTCSQYETNQEAEDDSSWVKVENRNQRKQKVTNSKVNSLPRKPPEDEVDAVQQSVRDVGDSLSQLALQDSAPRSGSGSEHNGGGTKQLEMGKACDRCTYLNPPDETHCVLCHMRLYPALALSNGNGDHLN